MAIPEYKLSAVLCSHTMDVRCVATTKDSCILSASRDRTAILWHPEGTKDFVAVVTYKGHKNFVSCVCWLPPCEVFLEGLVVTGSNDNTILGYQLQDGTVLVTLEGHENVVCFISPGKESGVLLSSSWDSTAKIWNMNNPKGTPLTLQGHQAAVWSVVELANDTYATASADKTIKLWNKQGAQLKTLTGHTDCVRGLVVASAESFLSCANDASIRLWTNKGECLNTYYGHTNYIYSISMNPSLNPGGFATSGEEGSVRVWVGGECVREIPIPAQSVWSVTCLENSDIVTGSSDGIVRVFTRDPARYADEDTLKAYDAEIEKKIADSKLEIGGIKLSELPGPEILLEPGKTDGQTKLVRRGATVKCYSWSAGTQAWDEVGDVMGANPPADGKTRYQGKDYDFVFSVDIQEGAPALKLPFNRSEDPWVAAQAFIHTNNLPQGYLEQVANFIVTNAQVDSVPVSSNNGFADPFTGESRYVPGSATAPPPPRAPAADPLTGAGAYTTAAARQQHHERFVPHDHYLRFDQANLKAIHDKLKEFNSKVGDGHSSLSDAQLDNIVKLGELNGAYSADSVALLKKMLEWPKEILFPVLDITRLAIRNSEVNGQMFDATYGPKFINFLVALLAPENLTANQMLSLRVLVNAFAALPGEMSVLAAREEVVRSVSCLENLSNNAQIAASSLLLNLSVALAQQTDTVDLVSCLVRVLNRTTDNEAYFRGVVALGTLLSPGSPAPLRAAVAASGALRARLQRDCAAAEPRARAARHILSCLL